MTRLLTEVNAELSSVEWEVVKIVTEKGMDMLYAGLWESVLELIDLGGL